MWGVSQPTARFGSFEVDFRAGELRKHGLRLRLQVQPFQILAMLLERPGEVVTREELGQALWPGDTFVDFDHGLNNAINRLREALSDSAESPRYVETLPRRGYRFIAQVDGLVAATPPSSPAQIPTDRHTRRAVSALVDAVVGAHRARRRWRVGAVVAGATALALAVGLFGVRGLRQRVQGKTIPPKIQSIAVLPFKNLSSEPDGDYFSDGLTDEIIRNLSIIDGLQVRSRTSSFAFKDKPRNIHEVGVELGVNLVLEGSVLRVGQQLRINAQVVRVHDDFPLWSGRFDRQLTDVFAIQDEISRGIVNNLRLKLGHGRRRYETSVEAYDLYLRARSLSLREHTVFAQILQLFEQAVAKDPSFAPAHAGLAATYAVQSVQFPPDHPPDELVKMRAAAEKAIQLDPLLAEAHDALGLVYARDAQWEQAEKSFRRAVELDPNRSSTYVDYAFWLLAVLGRNEEALQQLHVAEKADPLSPDVHIRLAVVLISAGRYDEAAEHCLKLPADHALKWMALANAQLGQGKTGEAIQILANDQTHLIVNPHERGLLGYAYARSGQREEAEKMAGASRYANEQALIFAGLGDKERTLEALDRVAALGAQRLGLYLNSPELAFLRGDQRLKALRKKVGLPE